MAATIPRWLEWAREIQALAQTSTHYAENEYQRERYHRLSEIAAEMIAENTGIENEVLNQLFCAPTGYATPRIDVRGAVFQEGKLLMVRERADGGWCMPGGWADVGDIPSQAAEREVWEEAGFRVKASKVLGVYDANRVGPLDLFHAFKVVFVCDLVGGAPTPSRETSEVAFFAKEEIPAVLSNIRTPLRLIQAAFESFDDPSRPTEFD